MGNFYFLLMLGLVLQKLLSCAESVCASQAWSAFALKPLLVGVHACPEMPSSRSSPLVCFLQALLVPTLPVSTGTGLGSFRSVFSTFLFSV